MRIDPGISALNDPQNCPDLIALCQQATECDFLCYAEDDYVVIETSYEYSDGDCIFLYLRKNSKGVIHLTDFGESARHVSIYNIDLSPEYMESFLKDDVLWKRGQYYIEISPDKNLCDCIRRLAEVIMLFEQSVKREKERKENE